MSPVEQLTADRPLVPALALARPRARALVVVAVLVLAALTFLAPSAPTYDPWAWIIWGREILHLDLSTRRRPVVEAAAGPAHDAVRADRRRSRPTSGSSSPAPARWPASSLAFRLGAPPRRRGRGRRPRRPRPRRRRRGTIRNAALGNSEGLLVALALGAVDRHLAGRRGQAFALGVGAGAPAPRGVAVPRPLRRSSCSGASRAAAAPRRRRRSSCLPVLWLLPELWGSGDLLRAMHRAQTPRADSAAFAAGPGARGPRAVRVHADARRLARARRARRRAGPGCPRRARPGRELRAVAGLALGAVAWVALVAYMTPTAASRATPATSSCPRRSCSCSRARASGWALRRGWRRAPAVRRGGRASRPRRRRRRPLRPAEPRAAGADAPQRRLPGAPDRRARPGRRAAPAARSASLRLRHAAYTGPSWSRRWRGSSTCTRTTSSSRPPRPAVVFRARTTSRAPARPEPARRRRRGRRSGRSPPRRGGASSGPAG